jgi:hypothetical protein
MLKPLSGKGYTKRTGIVFSVFWKKAAVIPKIEETIL